MDNSNSCYLEQFSFLFLRIFFFPIRVQVIESWLYVRVCNTVCPVFNILETIKILANKLLKHNQVIYQAYQSNDGVAEELKFKEMPLMNFNIGLTLLTE